MTRETDSRGGGVDDAREYNESPLWGQRRRNGVESTIVNSRPRSGPDGTRSRQSSIPVILSFLAPSAPLCCSPPRRGRIEARRWAPDEGRCRAGAFVGSLLASIAFLELEKEMRFLVETTLSISLVMMGIGQGHAARPKAGGPLEPVLTLLNQGKIEEGERMLRQRLKDNPDDSAARRLLGRVADFDGRPDEAVKTWEEGLKQTAEDFPLLMEIGQIRATAGPRRADNQLSPRHGHRASPAVTRRLRRNSRGAPCPRRQGIRAGVGPGSPRERGRPGTG